MSSDRSPSPSPDEGLGCRPLAVSSGVLLGFAIVSTALGLTLALGDGSPGVQQLGFAFYGAGAPISGVFAAIAGELPLAPFTDAILWLVAAVGATSLAERRSMPLPRVLWSIVAVALSIGVVISFLIERL